jgi:proteasome lid subunit RPN8/RPN11
MNTDKIKIKRGLLLELLEASKNTYPNEFFAFLGKDNNSVIDHFIIVPLFYSANDSVSYRTDTLPFDFSIAGTIHSHPSYSGRPSSADLHSFEKRGFIHLIIAYPYTFESIFAYDRDGNKVSFEII